MVRADHQQAGLPGQGVLGDHAGARLDVALGEVGHRVPGRVGVLRLEAVDGALDVEDDARLRLDEGERQLRVLLVGLHAVRQADRDELGEEPLGRELLDRELGQAPGEGRVLPAAHTEDEALRSGGPEVGLEEVDAVPDLVGGIDGRAHLEGGDDL
ncbi:hypothetical protein MAFF212519_12160 [Clavibacter michiganensis]